MPLRAHLRNEEPPTFSGGSFLAPDIQLTYNFVNASMRPFLWMYGTTHYHKKQKNSTTLKPSPNSLSILFRKTRNIIVELKNRQV